MALPSVALPSTAGGMVDLSTVDSRWLVVFCYPMTGRPDVALPEGWNDIPGARGCTPQNLAYASNADQFAAIGASVFGLSVQDTAYQLEMVERLAVSHAVLSDAAGVFSSALRLPTFHVDETTLLKRLTLIASHGVIRHVTYPVFPPDRDSAMALEWLEAQG